METIWLINKISFWNFFQWSSVDSFFSSLLVLTLNSHSCRILGFYHTILLRENSVGIPKENSLSFLIWTLFFLDRKTWQITKRKSLCKTWRWRALRRPTPLGLAWSIHSSREAEPSTYTTSEFGAIKRRECTSSTCCNFTLTKTHWEGASTYCNSIPTCKTNREGSSSCCNSTPTCKTHWEGEILSGNQDGWFWFGWPCEGPLVTQSQHQ